MKKLNFLMAFMFAMVLVSQAQAYYTPVPPFTPYNPNYPSHPHHPHYPYYPQYPNYNYGAFYCGTPVGSCPIAPGPVGFQCYCNTWNGQIWGNVFIAR
ncbi:MAG: hypothetical protein ACK5WZ_02365 [Pseudobdellovibrionaceae bacterium]